MSQRNRMMKPTKRKQWLQLGFALFCVWAVVFIFAPALQSIGVIKTMHDHIGTNGIDASALYYTDSPEFNGADLKIKNAIETPHSNN